MASSLEMTELSSNISGCFVSDISLCGSSFTFTECTLSCSLFSASYIADISFERSSVIPVPDCE